MVKFTLLHSISNKSFQIHGIIDIIAYKRSFRLFDRDKPYELYIRYYEPEKIHTSNIIFMPGFLGIPLEKNITMDYYFRFGTEKECLNEKNIIETKKTILQKEKNFISNYIKNKYNL